MFNGLITALVTPFRVDGSLDIEGLSLLVDFQVENAIDALLILGTTGEAPTLSAQERDIIISLVVERVAGRIPVIVGCGTNSTAGTLAQMERATALGANGLMIVTPYYNRPTQAGLRLHFETIANASTLPICLYNIPKRTGCQLSLDTVEALFAHPQIVAIKDCSGDMCYFLGLIAIADRQQGCSILLGDDSWTLPAIAVGAHGLVSVLSNLIPLVMGAYVKSALLDDYGTARSMHTALWPLIQASCCESNPIPIKAMMALIDLPSGPTRLPLTEPSLESQELIASAVGRYACSLGLQSTSRV